jgi:predicted RNA-binding protein associated with RNAse of E/G family
VVAIAIAAFALVFAVAIPQTAAAHGGPGGFDVGRMGDSQNTYLADALGITVAELQAAQQDAAEAAIDQAVAEGLITETQAELAKQFSGRFAHGFAMSGHLGRFGNANIDPEALLANALGISVDELQIAQEEAQDAALAQAVEDGRITPEQAEQMAAMRELMDYFQEHGVPAQMKAVIEDAVQAAVEDGVITQEQADEFLSHEGFGKGFSHDFPNMRGPGGHDFYGKRGAPDFRNRDGREHGRPSFRGFGGRNFTPPTK